ncbi:hypothetical protein DL98DRAFT_587994 [Cadophora sp. DSE1049]|nr:hypothetical protein DL98DRAFT_587994 [Cadophora sp. DSE1049]
MSANPAAAITYSPLLVGNAVLEQMLQTAIATLGNPDEKMAMLLAMPTAQGISLRPGRVIHSITENREVMGLLIQLKGNIQSGLDACIHCQLESGPFVECVWVDDMETPIGCANREWQHERANSQLAHPHYGCITQKMINRPLKSINWKTALQTESTRIAPAIRQAYNVWLAQEIASFDHPVTAQAFAQEVLRRVLLQTGSDNPYVPIQGFPVRPDIEITEITTYSNNALSKANTLRTTLANSNLTPDEKYHHVAEGRCLDPALVIERTETWVLLTREPVYIFMVKDDKAMALRELRDLIDRRFTEGVVRAMGATYPIVSVASPNQPKTAVYLRLKDDADFKFDRGRRVRWQAYNRNQRANIPPIA